MQESQKQRILGGSDSLYTQPVQEVIESYCWQKCQIPEHNLYQEKSGFCTLDSSSLRGSYASYDASSTERISSSGSPTSQPGPQSSSSDMHIHSPENTKGLSVNESCMTNDVDDLRLKLRELETVMLGPNSDILDSDGNACKIESDHRSMETENWNRLMEMVSRRRLKEVLIACAQAVSDNDLLVSEWLMSELHQMVSVSGEPIQRLGAYMLEGLFVRLASSGSSICRTLMCKEPASSELLSYMHLLYDVCPYFKFGYMSANGAIAEAMKDENRIHIIDFQIAQGSQWVSLIQALAARPTGPPQIRITGINDSTSAYARGGGLDIVGRKLSSLAQSFNITLEFHSVTIGSPKVELEGLLLQTGEALAVNFPFTLHHMLDESVSTWNHRDGLLRLVKSLSPKVVTLIEQESNTNTTPFFPRFLETLDYYTAIFESIDVKLPREHKGRINVEQHCLARDVVNIIACEGAARVERHEVLGKWRSRFLMAGFMPFPLSPFVNATIKTLLESYCKNYRLEERDGALYLGWINRTLVTSSAWH
ncbi:DNA topoisomerase 2-associated protein pat1 [Ancistrocladus abbreviatus]